MKGAADANRGEAGAEIETGWDAGVTLPTAWADFQTGADQEIGSWEAEETAPASFPRPDMLAMFPHRIQGRGSCDFCIFLLFEFDK